MLTAAAALAGATAGITALAAAVWRLTRSARVRTPHHATGPLADRTYPLA